jgi:hypothetical protein
LGRPRLRIAAHVDVSSAGPLPGPSNYVLRKPGTALTPATLNGCVQRSAVIVAQGGGGVKAPHRPVTGLWGQRERGCGPMKRPLPQLVRLGRQSGPGTREIAHRAGLALLPPRQGEATGAAVGLGRRMGAPVAVSALGSPSCRGADALRLALSPREVCSERSASARYCLTTPAPGSCGSGSRSGPCRRQTRSSPARRGRRRGQSPGERGSWR